MRNFDEIEFDPKPSKKEPKYGRKPLINWVAVVEFLALTTLTLVIVLLIWANVLMGT